MYNNKSPGNDGLTKEFYKMFRSLEEPLLNSTRTSSLKQEGCSSQKHAAIKLIQKRMKIKDL